MNEKYQIIFANLPWATMTVAELCALTIPAEANALLYLCATAPKLVETLAVMEAWGFLYRTNAALAKSGEVGEWNDWLHLQHELLLVGRRGKFSPPPASLRVASVLNPDKIRELIVSWFPNATKVELFARENAAGWCIWTPGD